jgi:transcriptional regulator with XRE-family HTH domain
MVPMTLGERIRHRRQVLKITQQELAKALGLTPQHISAIEQDKRTPSLAFLVKAGKELGVSIDYLVSGEEGVITGIIPAIKADKTLEPETKKALIAVVRQLYKSGSVSTKTEAESKSESI